MGDRIRAVRRSRVACPLLQHRLSAYAFGKSATERAVFARSQRSCSRAATSRECSSIPFLLVLLIPLSAILRVVCTDGSLFVCARARYAGLPIEMLAILSRACPEIASQYGEVSSRSGIGLHLKRIGAKVGFDCIIAN